MARDWDLPTDLDDFPDVTVIPDAAPSPEADAERYGAAIVETARAYVGTRELPGNRGPLIRAWLAGVRIFRPAAWCTAFAVGALHEAAESMGLRSTCPREASGAKLWRWARQHTDQCTIIYDDRELRPGDVVILGSTSEKRRRIRAGSLASGHTYLAASLSGLTDGVHDTIEGNTSPKGSREGDGVYERQRTWFSPVLVGAIRFRAVEPNSEGQA